MNASPWKTVGRVGHALVVAGLILTASCFPQDGYSPKPGTSYDPETGLPLEIISHKDQAEMVLVKSGTFKKGDPRRPIKTVRLRPFYIDKYEVTNERYRRFVSATHHSAPVLAGDDAALFAWSGGTYPEGRAKHPVVLVTYEDARAFAAWAGKRLPTQEQWEYAARGADGREFPWGNAHLDVGECNTADRLAGRELARREAWQAWYARWVQQKPERRNADTTRPVGSFPKDVSAFGCFDMGGNVREWTTKVPDNSAVSEIDIRAGELPAVQTNGSVACGGSWLRGAARAWTYGSLESSRYYDVGFRCVVSADDPAIRKLARPRAD